jgi:hypothetical protein
MKFGIMKRVTNQLIWFPVKQLIVVTYFHMSMQTKSESQLLKLFEIFKFLKRTVEQQQKKTTVFRHFDNKPL